MTILQEITKARTLTTARNRLREAVTTLKQKHPSVAEYLDTYGEDILAVYSLPESHRRRMRSTNMLERYNQEIKR